MVVREVPGTTPKNPDSGFINNANNDPIGVSLDNNTLNQLRPNFNGIYYLNAGYADGYRMGRMDLPGRQISRADIAAFSRRRA